MSFLWRVYVTVLRTWPNLEFQTQSVSSLYRGCNAELFCACWPIHSLHMWIAPFVRASCSWLSLDVCHEEWDAPDALDLIRVVECVDGCRPQIGSKQELMASTLQVGSVHCFRFHLYDITVSYTVTYIFTNTSIKNIQIWTVSTTVFLVTNTQNRVIHLLYCTFQMFSFHFISVGFCAFLWVYKRLFASCIIILVDSHLKESFTQKWQFCH